ncbi:hypothetical protein OSB04_006504 [Centaurea solstitialis]|uniref:Uncharacterized protein n=1 Tax=Centaurea solstitialis TaxID=347529 RepID=A0AA38TI26_9ASTR|nr:hypothetical protein OSB04_006504 [Centaurea solstitialis]
MKYNGVKLRITLRGTLAKKYTDEHIRSYKDDKIIVILTSCKQWHDCKATHTPAISDMGKYVHSYQPLRLYRHLGPPICRIQFSEQSTSQTFQSSYGSSVELILSLDPTFMTKCRQHKA